MSKRCLRALRIIGTLTPATDLVLIEQQDGPRNRRRLWRFVRALEPVRIVIIKQIDQFGVLQPSALRGRLDDLLSRHGQRRELHGRLNGHAGRR